MGLSNSKKKIVKDDFDDDFGGGFGGIGGDDFGGDDFDFDFGGDDFDFGDTGDDDSWNFDFNAGSADFNTGDECRDLCLQEHWQCKTEALGWVANQTRLEPRIESCERERRDLMTYVESRPTLRDQSIEANSETFEAMCGRFADQWESLGVSIASAESQIAEVEGEIDQCRASNDKKQQLLRVLDWKTHHNEKLFLPNFDKSNLREEQCKPHAQEIQGCDDGFRCNDAVAFTKHARQSCSMPEKESCTVSIPKPPLNSPLFEISVTSEVTGEAEDDKRASTRWFNRLSVQCGDQNYFVHVGDWHGSTWNSVAKTRTKTVEAYLPAGTTSCTIVQNEPEKWTNTLGSGYNRSPCNYDRQSCGVTHGCVWDDGEGCVPSQRMDELHYYMGDTAPTFSVSVRKRRIAPLEAVQLQRGCDCEAWRSEHVADMCNYTDCCIDRDDQMEKYQRDVKQLNQCEARRKALIVLKDAMISRGRWSDENKQMIGENFARAPCEEPCDKMPSSDSYKCTTQAHNLGLEDVFTVSAWPSIVDARKLELEEKTQRRDRLREDTLGECTLNGQRLDNEIQTSKRKLAETLQRLYRPYNSKEAIMSLRADNMQWRRGSMPESSAGWFKRSKPEAVHWRDTLYGASGNCFFDRTELHPHAVSPTIQYDASGKKIDPPLEEEPDLRATIDGAMAKCSRHSLPPRDVCVEVQNQEEINYIQNGNYQTFTKILDTPVVHTDVETQSACSHNWFEALSDVDISSLGGLDDPQRIACADSDTACKKSRFTSFVNAFSQNNDWQDNLRRQILQDKVAKVHTASGELTVDTRSQLISRFATLGSRCQTRWTIEPDENHSVEVTGNIGMQFAQPGKQQIDLADSGMGNANYCLAERSIYEGDDMPKAREELEDSLIKGYMAGLPTAATGKLVWQDGVDAIANRLDNDKLLNVDDYGTFAYCKTSYSDTTQKNRKYRAEICRNPNHDFSLKEISDGGLDKTLDTKMSTLSVKNKRCSLKLVNPSWQMTKYKSLLGAEVFRKLCGRRGLRDEGPTDKERCESHNVEGIPLCKWVQHYDEWEWVPAGKYANGQVKYEKRPFPEDYIPGRMWPSDVCQVRSVEDILGVKVLLDGDASPLDCQIACEAKEGCEFFSYQKSKKKCWEMPSDCQQAYVSASVAADPCSAYSSYNSLDKEQVQKYGCQSSVPDVKSSFFPTPGDKVEVLQGVDFSSYKPHTSKILSGSDYKAATIVEQSNRQYDDDRVWQYSTYIVRYANGEEATLIGHPRQLFKRGKKYVDTSYMQEEMVEDDDFDLYQMVSTKNMSFNDDDLVRLQICPRVFAENALDSSMCSSMQCPFGTKLRDSPFLYECKGDTCTVENDVNLCCVSVCPDDFCPEHAYVPKSGENVCQHPPTYESGVVKTGCSKFTGDLDRCCEPKGLCESLETPAGFVPKTIPDAIAALKQRKGDLGYVSGSAQTRCMANQPWTACVNAWAVDNFRKKYPCYTAKQKQDAQSAYNARKDAFLSRTSKTETITGKFCAASSGSTVRFSNPKSCTKDGKEGLRWTSAVNLNPAAKYARWGCDDAPRCSRQKLKDGKWKWDYTMERVEKRYRKAGCWNTNTGTGRAEFLPEHTKETCPYMWRDKRRVYRQPGQNDPTWAWRDSLGKLDFADFGDSEYEMRARTMIFANEPLTHQVAEYDEDQCKSKGYRWHTSEKCHRFKNYLTGGVASNGGSNLTINDVFFHESDPGFEYHCGDTRSTDRRRKDFYVTQEGVTTRYLSRDHCAKYTTPTESQCSDGTSGGTQAQCTGLTGNTYTAPVPNKYTAPTKSQCSDGREGGTRNECLGFTGNTYTAPISAKCTNRSRNRTWSTASRRECTGLTGYTYSNPAPMPEANKKHGNNGEGTRWAGMYGFCRDNRNSVCTQTREPSGSKRFTQSCIGRLAKDTGDCSYHKTRGSCVGWDRKKNKLPTCWWQTKTEYYDNGKWVEKQPVCTAWDGIKLNDRTWRIMHSRDTEFNKEQCEGRDRGNTFTEAQPAKCTNGGDASSKEACEGKRTDNTFTEAQPAKCTNGVDASSKEACESSEAQPAKCTNGGDASSKEACEGKRLNTHTWTAEEPARCEYRSLKIGGGEGLNIPPTLEEGTKILACVTDQLLYSKDDTYNNTTVNFGEDHCVADENKNAYILGDCDVFEEEFNYKGRECGVTENGGVSWDMEDADVKGLHCENNVCSPRLDKDRCFDKRDTCENIACGDYPLGTNDRHWIAKNNPSGTQTHLCATKKCDSNFHEDKRSCCEYIGPKWHNGLQCYLETLNATCPTGDMCVSTYENGNATIAHLNLVCQKRCCEANPNNPQIKTQCNAVKDKSEWELGGIQEDKLRIGGGRRCGVPTNAYYVLENGHNCTFSPEHWACPNADSSVEDRRAGSMPQGRRDRFARKQYRDRKWTIQQLINYSKMQYLSDKKKFWKENNMW